ncbi:hypothetical protein PMAYCL1PPCAC_17347 [Pristionchus mayeri]|uniref:Serpentine receptor class gamma n=1 Tax=Pristionchus mayeri TaxID=1317129 RepID=A0AAN5CML8_9BILA|nr:hypothetical protein PMAYCL1PPCAC_17347 [Pristionchus mayeri]
MVSIYIICQLITRDLIFGEEFLFESNDSIFPEFYFYGTHYYFMYVQVFGVLLQSSNRFICVYLPFTRLHKAIEQIPIWALLLATFIVPAFPMIPMILRSRITFHRNLDGVVDLLIPTKVVQQNAIQGMVSTVFATVICSICYIVVIYKLARMRTDRHSLRDFKREKMLTIVGFAVFICLCVETVYYIFLASTSNEIVDKVRVYYVYPTILMAFVNPWMLFITNENMRKRALGIAVATTPENAVTLRTGPSPSVITK